MVWTCRAQHRLDCRSTQAECGCTEKIWQAKEIMGWSAWEWQKEARYGFCWPSKSFWVGRTPSRKTCQKAQPSVEENRALKWIWWWWWPPKRRTSDWLIHNWADEYSVMHATSHLNGDHLKPRTVGLSHISFKTIMDNYLRVFPLLG